MTTQTTPNSTEQYETIKLGIDAHAQWYYVSRQVDGATPETLSALLMVGFGAMPLLRRHRGSD